MLSWYLLIVAHMVIVSFGAAVFFAAVSLLHHWWTILCGLSSDSDQAYRTIRDKDK